MVIFKKSLIVFVLLILVTTNILIFIKPNETKEIVTEQVAQKEVVEETTQEITSRSLDITRSEEVNTTEENNEVKTEEVVEQEVQPEPEVKVESTYFPTVSHTISSKYGYRSRGDFHTGIDLCGKYGDNIYAYKSGIVVKTQYSNVSYGNMILIKHEDGTQTRYAHLSRISVSLNENVKGGQIIGYMGSTGNSTGNHLHFEVIVNGSTVNPYSYIF